MSARRKHLKYSKVKYLKANPGTEAAELIYGRMAPGRIEELMPKVPEIWMDLLKASRRAPPQMSDAESRRALQDAISAIDSIHLEWGSAKN